MDLTGISTGTWSEQHCNMYGSKQKENMLPISTDFFIICNCFKFLVTKLVKTTTGVVARDDVNKDTVFETGTGILSGEKNKKLRELSLEIRDQDKTLVIMR